MALTTVDNGLLSADSQYTGFKNRIINGGMVIDQRNAGASVSATNGGYTLDRWTAVSYDNTAQTGKFTVQQNAGSVTPPAGFTNYLGVTSSATTTVSGNGIYAISQYIEGYNIADLAWGTASAKSVTVSFWVYSSLTGTFGGAINNGAGNYNYPFQFVILSANTWTYCSVVIPAPTSGTWLTTNGSGVVVRFGLGAGVSWSDPVGAWTTNAAYTADSSVSVVGTNGATFYITGVQLEKGSTATSFDYRPYGTELSLCQRYFETGSVWKEGTNAGAGAQCVFTETFKVVKRGNATFTFGNVNGANANITSISGPEAMYEWISPFNQTNLTTGFAFRFVPSNATSTMRQYWLASAEL